MIETGCCLESAQKKMNAFGLYFTILLLELLHALLAGSF